MSLRLLAAPEALAELWELDTQGVGTDRVSGVATAFVSEALTHPVDVGTNVEAKVRRLNQWFTVVDDLTVEMTPVVDGVVRAAQALTVRLAVADGERQLVEVPVSATGQRFGVQIRVLAGSGGAVGQASLRFIPKRNR